MAPTWPRETVWSTEPKEHATQLAGCLRDTLNCIDRSQIHLVPAEHVKAIIVGAVALIAKVQKMPDLSDICSALKNMQAAAKDTAQATDEVLAKVRDELKENATGIHKSIGAGEAAERAAKEAADIGKTAVGIAREIKNRGPQIGAIAPASYAAVAASGAPAAGTHNTQSIRSLPAQAQREITVSIRNTMTIESLRAMNPRNLKSHVQRAIEQSGNEQIASTKIMSANQLKSGDLSVRTANGSETLALRRCANDWAHLIGNGASIRNPTYGVLAHGIRTSSIDMERFEENKDNILQENRPFIRQATCTDRTFLSGSTLRTMAFRIRLF